MKDDDLQQVGGKVVKGLRDNLLKPMHNSLASQMKEQHDSVMLAVVEDLPKRMLKTLADSFKNVKWDDDESES